MRVAGSEGFTQNCRSETLTTKSISIPDSYQSEGFTPVCRIAEVKPSLKALYKAQSVQQKGNMRIAGSEGFTPVCRIAEVKPSLKAVYKAKRLQ